MSKRIDAKATCPDCNHAWRIQLYRSLWVEDGKNRQLVAEDKVNVVACPECGLSQRIEFPFLCTNVKRNIAIWYEPYPDPEIDKDIALYAKSFGQNSFYARAPRVKSWNEFKAKLIQMEGTLDPDRPKPKASEEASNIFQGVIDSLKSTPPNYPTWLSHLRNIKARVLYSLIPFALWIVLVGLKNGSDTLNVLLAEIGNLLKVFVVFIGSTFLLLSAIHFFAKHRKPWRETSKNFRLYVFTSLCWIAGVLFVVAVLDLFDYGGFGGMYSDEIIHLLSILFGTPLLVGIAISAYNKFVH